jgi:hypothetical protein
MRNARNVVYRAINCEYVVASLGVVELSLISNQWRERSRRTPLERLQSQNNSSSFVLPSLHISKRVTQIVPRCW